MRRRLFILAALLLSAACAYAYEPQIRDISMDVRLCKDGSALITEKWDVTVASGTEWYLVKDNLGASGIEDLNVFDENGQFRNTGKWNIDASISQKAGKCGLNPIRNGYEICWGVGSYGPHQYTVMYRVTDAVDLLEDADCFHFQLVTPGLTATPDHVKVTIRLRDSQFDDSNVKFWGFGFRGPTYLEDGAVCLESADGYYTRNSSVVALLRFDKGLFDSGNRRDVSWQEVYDGAMNGADFGTDGQSEEDPMSVLMGLLFTGLLFYFFLIYPIKRALSGGKPSRHEQKKLLGCKMKDVTWARDIPYQGNLCATDYMLTKLGLPATSKNLSSAMMLRMIYKGVLAVRKQANGKSDFAIVPGADCSYMGEHEKEFYDFLVKAAGDDSVLQDKEFSKWAKANGKLLYQWSNSLKVEGADALREQKCISYSPEGQAAARQALGFKKFLGDFTRMHEKQSMEAVLWQEYLVFASMFGIADKVAKEMKDINPDLYTQMMPDTGTTFTDIYTMSRMFGNSMSNGIAYGRPASTVPSYSRGTASSSWGGFGGHSSFGGGGGFHGGGFGGGSR